MSNAKIEIEKVSGYGLSRSWFDFAFEEKNCKSQHTALYMWIVELNNRLGWKKQFGLPTNDTMEGLSIGNKNTYLSALRDLCEWGFVKIIKESKNQFQACIIELCYSESATAQVTALDTALIQHDTQQSNSTGNGTAYSIVPIDKPINNKQRNHKPLNRSVKQFQEIARTTFKNCQCSFGNDFKKLWFDLIQTDNWKKKSQSAYDFNLKRLMKFDEEFCQSLVETAIAGEYKGVVFPNTAGDYKKYLKLKDGITKTATSTADAVESRASLVAAAASILSRYSA